MILEWWSDLTVPHLQNDFLDRIRTRWAVQQV
jgi:hypothetical protein